VAYERVKPTYVYVFYIVKSMKKGENRGKEGGGRMMRLPGEGRGTSAGIFRTTALSFDVRATCDRKRVTNSLWLRLT
jgi:hypothetical protein